MNSKSRFVGECRRVEVSLRSLGKVLTGNTPSKKNEEFWKSKDIPFIKPGDIDDTEITLIHGGSESISEAARGKARIARPESVLVTCIGTIGKIAVVKEKEVAFNQQINCISVDETAVNPYYLAYALQANRRHLKILANAPVVPIINKSQFESICLRLDEKLEHQQEVVSKLDAIRDQQDSLKTIMGKLDQLVKSRFVEMFGDPCDTSDYGVRARIDSFCELRIGPFGSALHKKDYIEGGHKLINPSHIVNGKLCPDSTLSISDEKFESMSQYHLHIDDVVLGRRGEIGRCAVVDREGLICGTGSMILRPGTECRSDYLQRVISFPSFSRALEGDAVGVTMKNLNAKIVGSAEICLPPLELQDKFSTFVSQVDKTRSFDQQQIEKLQMLYDSLAQDYFS